MKYRNNRIGEPLSILGYGCMRFSRKGSGIDLEKTQEEINAEKKLVRAVPYLKMVTKWVDQAKALPRKLEY